MPNNNLVKILFRFYSDILDEETVETLQAEPVDEGNGYYKISNIPFYASIASGDIVWAEYSKAESALTYRKTIEPGGNSTIHVIMIDNEYDIEAIGGLFEEMGCKAEELNKKYLALEIPAVIDYLAVKKKLDYLEAEKVIDYAETCLSDRHQYKDYFF